MKSRFKVPLALQMIFTTPTARESTSAHIPCENKFMIPDTHKSYLNLEERKLYLSPRMTNFVLVLRLVSSLN